MKSPTRWGADDSEATPELREMIRHAQQCAPSADRLTALTAAVMAELEPPQLLAAPRSVTGKGILFTGSAKIVAVCIGVALSVGIGWKAWHESVDGDVQRSAEPSLRLQQKQSVAQPPAPVHDSPPPSAPAITHSQAPALAAKSRGRAKAADATEDFSLLQKARSVRRQDPVMALRVLNEHALRYPKSSVREERDALRIEIMRRVDPVAANALAAQFEVDFPGSVYGRKPRP